jgi:flagellar biosynthesis GTPase FlhF
MNLKIVNTQNDTSYSTHDTDLINKLKELTPIAYDRVRNLFAKEMGIRPATLDSIIKKELSEKKINKAIQQLENVEVNGVLLGVSTFTAKPVVLPDHFINQIFMVLGTTGSGKTVTLQRFYDHAITQGHPLIIIDGKPTEKNIIWLKNL